SARVARGTCCCRKMAEWPQATSWCNRLRTANLRRPLCVPIVPRLRLRREAEHAPDCIHFCTAKPGPEPALTPIVGPHGSGSREIEPEFNQPARGFPAPFPNIGVMMDPKRPSRKSLPALSADRGPEDGIDPRELTRREAQPRTRRKTM